jgi:hypothetical protein
MALLNDLLLERKSSRDACEFLEPQPLVNTVEERRFSAA